MTRRVALFRGVNVGGKNVVPMAELRDLFAGLGFTSVTSVIQSGNVCFDADDWPDDAADDLAAAIQAAVQDRFDVDTPVLLRTVAEFLAVVQAHPYPMGEIEPKLHHIMFLSEPAPADAEARIGDQLPDEYTVLGREIHIRYPQGSARSKLSAVLVDRRLGLTATARNIPTVERIAAALAPAG